MLPAQLHDVSIIGIPFIDATSVVHANHCVGTDGASIVGPSTEGITMTIRAAVRHAVITLLLLAAAAHALGQAYPMRPIRLVVPFPPGGAVDFFARVVQQPLSEALGQQIVIDNKAGASGMVGAEN